MIKNKPNLVILVNAFVSAKSIGGGDRFIMEVAPTLSKSADTTIILPKVGYRHWLQKGLAKAKYIVLRPTVFDNRDNPFAIMLAYLIRCLQTIVILKRSRLSHLVTASHSLPDILPAAVIKWLQPDIRWTARMYHLIPSPTKRVGNPLTNTAVFLLQRLSLLFLRYADLIVADNRETLIHLRKMGFLPNNLKLLLSGIDYQTIANHIPRKNFPFAAAYIGRLDPHKGIFDLPQVWRLVVKTLPKTKLAIAGYGPKETTRNLTREFNRNNPSSSFSFVGFLPHEENGSHPLYDLLKSIKVLLLPNHEGGWPLTVAEAMAAGVPVVAYDLTIFRTAFTRGRLIAPMKDKHIFAKHVIALLSDERRRKKIGHIAEKQARQYDVRPISRQFAQLILGNGPVLPSPKPRSHPGQ